MAGSSLPSPVIHCGVVFRNKAQPSFYFYEIQYAYDTIILYLRLYAPYLIF